MRIRFGGRPPPTITQFSQVPLGGGGFVTDLRMSADGLTRVHATDVSPGGYVWKNPDNLDATDATGTHADFRWVPFFNEISMAGENTTGSGDAVLGNWGNGYGCHDITFAPSDPTIIYMIAPGLEGSVAYIWKSTDRGKTVTRMGLAGAAGSRFGPQADNTRMWGPKSDVNPNDADHIMYTVTYGTDAGALMESTDGGATASVVSTFPESTGTYDEICATAVHWDPSTSGVVYAFSQNAGLYKSTDSGATWTLATGSPTTCRRLHVDQFGQVWVTTITGAENVWRLDGATWTNMSTTGGLTYANIASNPLSASKVDNQITVQHDGGLFNTSFDNGATWSGFYGGAGGPIRVAPELLWMADANENYMTAGNIIYDTQAVSGFSRGRMWSVEGIGVWYTHPPTDDARPTFTELTRGNEELICVQVIKPRGAGRPVFAMFHDRAIFALDGTNFPTAQLVGRDEGLQHCFAPYSGDYAGQAPDEAAFTTHSPHAYYYVTDGGAGGYATVVETSAIAFDANEVNPNIAVSAGGISNMVVSSGSSTGVTKYTTDSGATWSTPTYSGGTPGAAVRPLSDKVTSGKFWLTDSTNGIWVSTDSGATFTKVRGIITDQQSGKFKARPDAADELWFAYKQATTGGVFREAGLLHPYLSTGDYGPLIQRSVDGGLTWSDLGLGWVEVHDLGFGKAAPGQSFPTLYVVGARLGDTPGVYRSTDTAVTWTRLDGPYSEYPTGVYDAMISITGDMDVYGDVWIGMGSTGVIKGRLV
jgi:hypothetical protein